MKGIYNRKYLPNYFDNPQAEYIISLQNSRQSVEYIKMRLLHNTLIYEPGSMVVVCSLAEKSSLVVPNGNGE